MIPDLPRPSAAAIVALVALATLACSAGGASGARPAPTPAPAPAPTGAPSRTDGLSSDLSDAPAGTASSPADTWPAHEGPTLAVVPMQMLRGLEPVDAQPRTLQAALTSDPAPSVDASALPPGAWLHGAVPVTKTESVPFAVSADRAWLILDADRDGRLSPQERLPPAESWGGFAWFAGAFPVRQKMGERVLQSVIPVRIGVMLAAPRAVSRLDGRREGIAEIAGRRVRLAIVDQTFRGWFGHPRLDALMVDVDGDGTFDNAPDSFERYRLGDPFPVGDQDVVAVAIGPLGTSLTLARSPKVAERRASLRIGSAAPAFAATTTDGKAVSLDALRGKWVLLDFWATWCGPCRMELPNLKALRREHGDVVILGVSGDQQAEAVTRFVKAEGLDWAQVHGDARKLMGAYRVGSFPTSFLIDPDGKIAARDLRGPGLVGEIGRLKTARTSKKG